MNSNVDISLPAKWVHSDALDDALHFAGDVHGDLIKTVNIHIPTNCKVMVDAAVRLLCLANQLSHRGKQVKMTFHEGQTGAMGYLDRIGFFGFLSSGVTVDPTPPALSGSWRYKGSNPGLMEIEAITPKRRDQTLPGRLADRLKEAANGAEAQSALSRAAFTVFGELIDNVFQHSSTILDGYAALQFYTGRAKVIVSDSGDGLLQTLRPALQKESSTYASLSDVDLLVAAFTAGVSRFGSIRGMGLKTSAETALKYNADLHVRLPRCQVHLIPARAGYGVAHFQDGLPLMWGTHISFDFNIDH
ncbi:MAG: hypothetical protein K2Y39_06285 [Candidatus Obscuribacterales bacterium]|nr:hypothetical protein [Candidatus Obscuribacterales bacterium]